MKQIESIDDNPKTVIFRKDKATGHVIALFPLVPGYENAGDCYVFGNCWGSVEYNQYIKMTVPAIFREYIGLWKQLEKLGHKLNVRTHEEMTNKAYGDMTEDEKASLLNTSFNGHASISYPHNEGI